MAFQAKAGKLCFGVGDEFHMMAAVSLKDKDGRSLAISRKLTTSCFVFPYAQRDAGHVLTVSSDRNAYYPYPSKEEVERYPKLGFLPDAFAGVAARSGASHIRKFAVDLARRGHSCGDLYQVQEIDVGLEPSATYYLEPAGSKPRHHHHPNRGDLNRVDTRRPSR